MAGKPSQIKETKIILRDAKTHHVNWIFNIRSAVCGRLSECDNKRFFFCPGLATARENQAANPDRKIIGTAHCNKGHAVA
jgi:hypothetical protein